MTLQMALILLAVVVVAGVYFYSRWEGPRSRVSQSRSRSGHRDYGAHSEPSFGDVEYPQQSSQFEMDFSADQDDAISVDEDEDHSSIEYSIPPDAVQADLAQPELNADVDDFLEDDVQQVDNQQQATDDGYAQDEQQKFDQLRNQEDDLASDGLASDSPASDDHAVDDQVRGDQFTEVPTTDDQVVDDSVADGADDNSTVADDIPILDSRVDSSIEPDELVDQDVLQSADASLEDEPDPTAELISDSVSDAKLEKQHEPEPGVNPVDREPDIPELEDQIDRPAPDHQESVEPVTLHADNTSTEQQDITEASVADATDNTLYTDDLGDDQDDKPSLKAIIGSMNPIQKLRGSIKHQLDIVKAEREGTTPPVSKSTDKDKSDSKIFSAGKKWWGGDRRRDKRPGSTTDRNISLDPGLAPGDSEPGGGADDYVPDRDDPVFSGSETDPEIEQESDRREPTVSNAEDIDLVPANGFDKLSQIDYYVKLNGDRDVSRESVLAIYRESAAGLSKKHSIYGLRMPDKVWSDLENEPEESRFGDLVITMQLVDQDGPVSEHDMTRFSSLVMKLSESTGRGFAFMAPIENAHEQALAIDRFRKRFDSIFVVNIVPLEDDIFEGPVIDRCASQIGLTPDENGFYTRYKPMGKQRVCLYSLANLTDTGEFDMDNLRAVRTRGVTFFTRPTINRSPGAVFSEMVDAARAFASRIKGEVIAPGYDDLSNDDVEKIRQSIDTVAREMESYGINPGSDEATRLF